MACVIVKSKNEIICVEDEIVTLGLAVQTGFKTEQN